MSGRFKGCSTLIVYEQLFSIWWHTNTLFLPRLLRPAACPLGYLGVLAANGLLDIPQDSVALDKPNLPVTLGNIVVKLCFSLVVILSNAR